eukprot:CAMPEP_0198422912 /NCGR_PEP_ID=MMETSP1452-20131203/2702_1 /TAXON_ID=1181717 /ORGANISM="Synchroma pusillum, Strain CCMP3072" /LENGTH=93 /DNA_ID=CAMNT_0044143187 /DNA_START=18 /DNA_END=296 /DNA_ORIENTATION=-
MAEAVRQAVRPPPAADDATAHVPTVDWTQLRPDVDRPLGSGGFGTVVAGVYQDRPAAIKFLNREALADGEVYTAVAREARVHAAVQGHCPEHV